MFLWVLHHLLLIGLLIGVGLLFAYFPVLAMRWKSPILAILLIALFAQWMFDKGAHSNDKALAKAKTEIVYRDRIINQGKVTTKVVDHYITQLKVVHDKGATIIKEVPKYVPINVQPLPYSFGVFLNSAATGVPLPDTASIPDGYPIPAQNVAASVAENYSICHENETQLTSLQEWIKEQAAAAK